MVTNNQILLILTIPITIGAGVTIVSFLATTGIIGGLESDIRSLSNQVDQQPALEDLLAQLPVAPDPVGVNETVTEIIVVEQPAGFTATDQDLITAFLDAIGVTVTETFGVTSEVNLIDADFVSQIESSFVKIQPLDPREVVLPQAPEIENLRFFINTDFSRQLADNGRNYHKFSGWNIVNDFGGASSIPVTMTTTTNCGSIPNTGLCVQTVGSKNDDDKTANGSVLHGFTKTIDLSDWTREGELVFNLDYNCNEFFHRSSQMRIIVKGDTSSETRFTCDDGKHTEEISGLIGNSNSVTIQFGGQALSVDKFRMDYKFNNVQVIGNSIIKRMAQETISLIDGLSIVQNNQDQTILDLGIIEVKLIGDTIFDNEKVVLQGDFETRINDATISQHQLTANGFSQANKIPIKIDGQDSFFFKLDEQFYGTDTFNKLTFIVNNMIVNVGEGEELRTFEYHIPFVAYLLEFNVRPNEIVAFNEEDLAISVLKNDSTLITCGLSAGDINAEVLPPAVNIIANGFTLGTTNPDAGKGAIRDPLTSEIQKDAEFCQTFPNLPRNTEITYKIGNEFFEVFSPVTQANYFVKCTTSGCSSNIGYATVTP